MNVYMKLQTEGEFNAYLIFESTTHEYRYKFTCYGSPTNCFLHKIIKNDKTFLKYMWREGYWGGGLTSGIHILLDLKLLEFNVRFKHKYNENY